MARLIAADALMISRGSERFELRRRDPAHLVEVRESLEARESGDVLGDDLKHLVQIAEVGRHLWLAEISRASATSGWTCANCMQSGPGGGGGGGAGGCSPLVAITAWNARPRTSAESARAT